MIEVIEELRVDGRWIVLSYAEARELALMLSLGRRGEPVTIEAFYQGEWQMLPPVQWTFVPRGGTQRPLEAPPPGFW